MKQSQWTSSTSTQSSRWISREFLELLGQVRNDRRQRGVYGQHFDVLIVGSGYGGAMAAQQLAGSHAGQQDGGRPLSIGVLERGREYLPGTFPSRMADLPTAVRGSFAGHARGGEALFDLRIGSDVNVVLANGLGGGSLINAGVMEVPQPEVFDYRWPQAWRSESIRAPYYQRARELLGASRAGKLNTIQPKEGGSLPGKTLRMQELARPSRRIPPAKFELAAITVAMQDGGVDAQGAVNGAVTSGGVKLKACRRCGDCATGCNHSAKESLDTNLLVAAHRGDVEIYCGATVLRVARTDDGKAWKVLVRPTDEALRLREGKPTWITTRYLILSAGTLGSTEILLRSQRASLAQQAAGEVAPRLRFSSRLGQGFSTNGDMITFGYNEADNANSIADEDQSPQQRDVGPTITGIVRTDLSVPGAPTPQKIVMEELAVPGALRRWTEEMLTTADTLHSLGEFDWGRHAPGYPKDEPYAVQPWKMGRTMVYAAMGDDGAQGTLQLREPDGSDERDGTVTVEWPGVGKLPLFTEQNKRLRDLTGARGRQIPNPLWKLLPDSMDFLIRKARGPLLTVHPLGGCAMGGDVETGVVDEFGRVYCNEPADDGAKAVPYDGLWVLDGAIVPSALCTNPSLTIAALALRAVEQMRKDHQWRWEAVDFRQRKLLERPVLLLQEAERAAQATPPQTDRAPDQVPDQAPEQEPDTVVQISERLTGEVTLLDADQRRVECVAELTLTYAEIDARKLYRVDGEQGNALSGAHLRITDDAQSSSGVLSLYRKADWEANRDRPPDDPCHDPRHSKALSYAVTGDLRVLRRERSTALGRIGRGLWAWARNRGLRDIVQDAAQGADPDGPTVAQRAFDALHLASRAGEIRLFEYDLLLGKLLPSDDKDALQLGCFLGGHTLKGHKHIGYTRPSNPWRQLQELLIDDFPRLASSATQPVLKLDPAYLAARQAPLIRITKQRDHVVALTDVAGLMLLLLRMMISIHIWNARKPELPTPRTVQRLPGRLPGLPEPDVHTLEVDRLEGQPVSIRLTRYRSAAVLSGQQPAVGAPVLMIHGYSASGTTFAHPSLRPSLAGDLASRNRDVWVLDLRTSCGLPTALVPWTFEHVAVQDIPAAIDLVYAQTGRQPVDVVAHCMGAAMLSMAILGSQKPLTDILSGRESREGTTVMDRFAAARRAVPDRIRRIVLSQVGPVVVMRPENIFRAYLLSFIEQVLAPLPYAFRNEKTDSLGMELFDRFLGTVPYPDEEFRAENPLCPLARRRYVAARHRMDALYGRTFKLANLRPETLDQLDDFFGPLSLDTVSQVMHFAALRTVTNRAGRNRFVTQANLSQLWKAPTLSLHGRENGLADVSTLTRMQRVMSAAGCSFQTFALEGCGHQDSLIGTRTEIGFAKIREFLDAPDTRTTESSPAAVGDKKSPATPARPQYVAYPPRYGVMRVLGQGQQGHEVQECWSLGPAPELSAPHVVLAYPALRDTANRWRVDHVLLKEYIRQGRAHLVGVLNRSPEDDPASDWFTMDQLPEWVDDPRVQHVAVLMLYAQSAALGMPKSPDFNTMDRDRTWSLNIGDIEGIDKSRLPLISKQPANGYDDVLQYDKAMHKAIRIAVRRAFREMAGDERPAGILDLQVVRPRPLPETSTPRMLRLALGSCQYAPGLLDRVPAYDAWRTLSQQWDQQGDPACTGPVDLIVLAGDQVYTDASAGLFDPSQADDRYRKPYEAWLSNRMVQSVMQRVPVINLLDDHEIVDNWEPCDRGTDPAQRHASWNALHEGLAGFRRYQRPQWNAQRRMRGPGAAADLQFERHQVLLYLLDSRTQRQHRSSVQDGNMLDERQQQWMSLTAWLLKHKGSTAPKLIVAPALFLPRHRHAIRAELLGGITDAAFAAALRSDSFDGYPDTFYKLLAFIADEDIRGIVLLSGDEHLGIYSHIRVTSAANAAGVTIHSIHSPGLYTPYRFANAHPEDFVLEENFAFRQAGQAADAADYHCEVKASLHAGSGFVRVHLARDASQQWMLSVCHADGTQWLAPTTLSNG